MVKCEAGKPTIATRIILGMIQLAYDKHLKALALHSLEIRMMMGDLIETSEKPG